MAEKLAFAVDREDVRELLPLPSLRPETVPGRLDEAVDVDGRELRDHERPRGVRGMGEQPHVRHGPLQRLVHLAATEDRKPPQRRQRLVGMESPEHEREHPGAEPGAEAGSLDRVHLPEYPGHRLGRHDPDHRVPARAGQAGHDGADVGRVQVAKELPSGLLVAGVDQIADLLRDLRRFVQRYGLPGLVPRIEAACGPGRAMRVSHVPLSLSCAAAYVANRTSEGMERPTKARRQNGPPVPGGPPAERRQRPPPVGHGRTDLVSVAVGSVHLRLWTWSGSDGFQEWVLYGQLSYPLTVLQILGVEAFATRFERGGDDEGIVESEPITRLDVQGCVIEANTWMYPEQWRKHRIEVSSHLVLGQPRVRLSKGRVETFLHDLEADARGTVRYPTLD